MAYDLALDRNNDLVFAANKDLLGVSGTAIYDQRIKTRLKIRRGSWVLDLDLSIGSRLDMALGKTADKAMSEIVTLVHEALDHMEDISVVSVEVVPPTDERASML